MTNPQLARIPIAKPECVIRKPVKHVFEAIVNPDVTTKLWFSKGSGRLEIDKAIIWDCSRSPRLPLGKASNWRLLDHR